MKANLWLLGFLLLLSGGTAAKDAPSRDVAQVVVRLDQPRQVIEGFGASGCWWAQEVGNWPEATRREVGARLFDREHGIGLTIYRHNLGAGSQDDAAITRPLRRAESLVGADGALDWSRDAAATRLLHEFVAIGAQRVILFAVSPPVGMTKNGRAYGARPIGGIKTTNLAPGREADFARYLGAATAHFVGEAGLPVTGLSPLNEPEWGWDEPKQEGCHYSPAETVRMLRAADTELQARALPVRLEGPELGSWETAIPYLKAIAADPVLRARLSDIGVHSYFSQAAHKAKLRAWLDAHWPGARLHMTEWCELKTGRDFGMDSGLVLARTVLEDLVIGRVCSWQYWLAATPHDYRDGLLQLEPATKTVRATKRLSALGQVSRFFRPGSVVLEVHTPWAEPRAVGARLAGGEIALVCANSGSTPQKIQVTFSDGRDWRLVTAFVTDPTLDLAAQPVADEPAFFLLPAESVTTFVMAPR
ncbi:MAG: hypothetical protein H7343_24115 [Undibacterium sp.]|nr:hypothetical protein [Opitutaceae bacterium]